MLSIKKRTPKASLPNPRAAKVTSAAYRKRLQRARERDLFYSSFLQMDSSTSRCIKNKAMEVARYITGHCFDDSGKAPLNNPVQWAKFTPSSHNMYFGINQPGAEPGTVLRPGYGFGSGSQSIGLDKRQLKIYAMPTSMIDLCNQVRGLVIAADDCYANKCDFTNALAKTYYGFKDLKGRRFSKKTGLHADVTYDEKGNPKPNNTQKPNTLTAVVNVGDTKILKFQRFKVGEKKPIPNSEIQLYQPNGSVFMLDPRDEKPMKRAEHEDFLSFWKHSAELVDKENGIAVAICFRVGNYNVPINPTTNKLIAPKQTDRRTQRFDHFIATNTTDSYKSTVKKLDAHVAGRFGA